MGIAVVKPAKRCTASVAPVTVRLEPNPL